MDATAPALADAFAVDTDVDLATLPTETIMGLAAGSARRMSCEAGLFVHYTGELRSARAGGPKVRLPLRPGWSSAAVVSLASARSFDHVGEQLEDLPNLTAGLSSGELTFDKVRAVADVATPANDRDLAEQARACTVRQLHDVARIERGAPRSRAETDHEARSLRFNDNFRTVTAQLPAESYAEVKSDLEARARALPSDGETRWDQRLCDGFLEVIRADNDAQQGGSPYVVVVHAPLATVADESSELAGELERGRTHQRRDGPPAGLRRHRDRCP